MSHFNLGCGFCTSFSQINNDLILYKYWNSKKKKKREREITWHEHIHIWKHAHISKFPTKISHLGTSLLFTHHVLISLNFYGVFGFFPLITVSSYPSTNWLFGELNLKNQCLSLLQIYYGVLLISHFVPYFIQVLICPWFFSFFTFFTGPTYYMSSDQTVRSQADFNYCREDTGVGGSRQELLHRAASASSNIGIWPHKRVAERAPTVATRPGI